MRLLQKQEAEGSLKRENADLLDDNIRLRELYGKAVERFRGMKDDYSEDKLKKLKEYESFCLELNGKKTKLLKELTEIEKAVSDRKETYYGLVAKQDALQERLYQVEQRERNLDMRENFIKEIEEKQHAFIHGA